MLNTLETPPSVDHIRSQLEAIEGVHRAFVDEASNRIYLVCESAEARQAITDAARDLLTREEVATDSIEIHPSYLDAPVTGGRVRFVEIVVDHANTGAALARTVLEWHGERFEGRAEGEGGPNFELRVCALATVRALDKVLDGRANVDLLGVKAVRIFDHDLVSVILRCPQVADRALIGTSLVLTDSHTSAALAVLNATNRVLGNFL